MAATGVSNSFWASRPSSDLTQLRIAHPQLRQERAVGLHR